MFSLIHRMIFWELFKVFVLCWIGLTTLILVGGVIAEATQQGLGPTQILEIIPFLIPSTMPYTLPTTTLFATCVVYGRLAHDNEILAVKAAGINMLQVVWPGVLLGGAASLGTAYLYAETIPVTQWQLRTRFVNNVEDYLYGLLRRDGFLRYPKIDYTIYAKRVEGRVLHDAQFMHRDKKTGQFDFVARAREARLEVDVANRVIKVKMFQGFIRKDNGDNTRLDEAEWPIDLPDELLSPKKFRASHMTWNEMDDFRQRWLEQKTQIEEEIHSIEATLRLGPGAPESAEHVRNLRNIVRQHDLNLRGLAAEIQIRPAQALGCLCFVLIGCPIGIWFSRSDYLSSFIICFLPIVTVYYPLMLCGINLAKSGKMPIPLVIWPANAILAIWALFLLRKLIRS